MHDVVAESWNLAIVSAEPVPTGNFTCWTLDASGAWTPTDGSIVSKMARGNEIGLKASRSLDAPPSGFDVNVHTRMVFTFTSPSGAPYVVQKSASSLLVIGGKVVEEARVVADELGLWTCSVDLHVSSTLWAERLEGSWGPFPIADVSESGDGDGGFKFTDQQKALLIAGGLAAGAIVLLKRE